jgi:hypothetical protein
LENRKRLAHNARVLCAGPRRTLSILAPADLDELLDIADFGRHLGCCVVDSECVVGLRELCGGPIQCCGVEIRLCARRAMGLVQASPNPEWWLQKGDDVCGAEARLVKRGKSVINCHWCLQLSA